MDQGSTAQREYTLGEKIVGLDFNPSGDPVITKIKQLNADAIDAMMAKTHEEEVTPLKQKRIEDAITAVLAAQMMLVKAVTFKF